VLSDGDKLITASAPEEGTFYQSRNSAVRFVGNGQLVGSYLIMRHAVLMALNMSCCAVRQIFTNNSDPALGLVMLRTGAAQIIKTHKTVPVRGRGGL
jgi:hypothetical protein